MNENMYLFVYHYSAIISSIIHGWTYFFVSCLAGSI